jgi:hypothetical protein
MEGLMKDLNEMTEPELRELFDNLALTIQERLPDETLFVLLAFDEPGVTQYVSNATRKSIIQAMREGADRLERLEDIKR